MNDRSLIWFTILSQAAIGTSVLSNGLALLNVSGFEDAFFQTTAATTALLSCLGLAVSLLHLGRPLRAARALSNLASSWLSREIFCGLAFASSALVSAGCWTWGCGSDATRLTLDAVSAVLGLCLLACMVWAYRLRTVPRWNTWRTPAAFCLTTAITGSMLTLATISLTTHAPPTSTNLALAVLVALLLVFASAFQGRATAPWRVAALLFILLSALLAHFYRDLRLATGASWLLALCLASVAELRDRERFYALRKEIP